MKTIPIRNFARDLRKTKDKKLLERVAAIIREIEAAKTLGDIPNLDKLEGYQDAYRIRIGNYRLGCLCDSETVVLARFLHRKDIYRSFP
jgi:mRNA interferase RelE/StbE